MYAKYTADGKSGLFRVLHPNIAVLPHFVYAGVLIQALTCSKAELEEQRRRPKRVPSTRREYEVAGAL